MNEDVRPFEEYKEMIKDMRKEEMIKGLYDLSKNITEKGKEIKKLNNRIQELEDGFKATTEDLCETAEEVERLNKIIQIKQNRINKLNKKLIRRDNIIEDLKTILKNKGYETYIPILERSDKE